jgi:hypothetical protein
VRRHLFPSVISRGPLYVKRYQRPLLARNGSGEKCPNNLAYNLRLPRYITGFFNMPQIFDKRIYFFSEGRHAEDFFALKNGWLRPGPNPRSLIAEASMLTTRPPKPLTLLCSKAGNHYKFLILLVFRLSRQRGFITIWLGELRLRAEDMLRW